jgi:hypothetical protein
MRLASSISSIEGTLQQSTSEELLDIGVRVLYYSSRELARVVPLNKPIIYPKSSRSCN